MKKLVKILTATTMLVMMAFLTACVPVAPELAQMKLENKGYVVEMQETDDGTTIAARKGSNLLTVIYCHSFDDAKEYYEDAKDEAALLGFEIKKKFYMVYAGTEEAVEDFEKLF